jgi:predicted dinucleotide-binding enzyme
LGCFSSAASRELSEAAGDKTNKVVIDISNPITADFKGLTIGHSPSAAEAALRAQGRLRHAGEVPIGAIE